MLIVSFEVRCTVKGPRFVTTCDQRTGGDKSSNDKKCYTYFMYRPREYTAWDDMLWVSRRPPNSNISYQTRKICSSNPLISYIGLQGIIFIYFGRLMFSKLLCFLTRDTILTRVSSMSSFLRGITQNCLLLQFRNIRLTRFFYAQLREKKIITASAIIAHTSASIATEIFKSEHFDVGGVVEKLPKASLGCS